jgi:hypothetical protein
MEKKLSTFHSLFQEEMMIKTNVVMLKDFRELKETHKIQETYKSYLMTLNNSQLEIEINFLLDEFSLDTFGDDFFIKVRMVQNEILSRADGDWKNKIERINLESNLRNF